MLFGITGAHRSGKTTLGRAVAEELGIHFHATSTTATALAHGFDPVAPMTLNQRVELQAILLDAHVKELDTLPRPVIVDRTPIDHLAYLLGEFHMQSHLQVVPKALDAVVEYHNLVFKIVPQYYDYVFHLGPLPGYEEDPTKPPMNKPYQAHFALLSEGILSRLSGQTNLMMIRQTDFEVRKNAMHDAIVERLDVIDKERRSSRYMN